MLALSVWVVWGHLLIAELSSERYTDHLRRQSIWTLAALTTVLVFGWTLTEFLGFTSRRDIQEQAQGDINLIASRFGGETGIVDGMVKAMAGSPSIQPLLTRGSAQDVRRALPALDLDVEASGARFGAILPAITSPSNLPVAEAPIMRVIRFAATTARSPVSHFFRSPSIGSMRI